MKEHKFPDFASSAGFHATGRRELAEDEGHTRTFTSPGARSEFRSGRTNTMV
jgi:hypothetical protein